MIIGELYFVKELFWLLFPTKELASKRWCFAATGGRAKQVKGAVSFVEPKTYVVLLEEDENVNECCYKLLDSNGNIGWIGWNSCSDFSRYFELVKANQ